MASFPVYSAMPTTESTDWASSASISSLVVMPPAAVRRRAVMRSQRQDRVEIGSAHQSFGIDVGVEELTAIRLECLDGVEGGQWQRGLPAVDDDVAAFAVDRGDHPLDADCVGQPLREVEVRAVRP